ncbi:Alpha/Beta hydrolase protein [Podospora australis]|uniref:Alpha/Beta hydrolase protein n=1 Tax=Podospora australis TaxID=1536484 RepID=A0AAN7AJM9_9PEZI|nr:Alpha/Beta hydrolase protein [Podospora australis]
MLPPALDLCRAATTPLPRLIIPISWSLKGGIHRGRRISSPTKVARHFCASTRVSREIPTNVHIDVVRKIIEDEFALIRDAYQAPKHPIVLAHGLLGFAELKLAGSYLPSIHYWRGIREALTLQGAEVITASVPPSGSIEQRAAKLAQDIEAQAQGKSVNVVAHSMGGLDARYMISQLRPKGVDVKSLITVGTPHHGSTFADYLIDEIGPEYLPRLYHLWEYLTGWDPSAFSQLTKRYMENEFNPRTPDDSTVQYYSYGAMVKGKPPLLSPFRLSHRIIQAREGLNDGLVSVESSQWGTYKGTLLGVNHLDLINWSNRLRSTVQRFMGHPPSFNAVAFYLGVGDMLAKEGL